MGPAAQRWLLSIAVLCVAGVLYAQAPAEPRIVEMTIHQYEDGPNVASTYRHIPGETVFFTARVANFASVAGAKEEGRRVAISFRVLAVDAQGVMLQPPQTGKVEAEITPQDKDWKPKIAAEVLVPPLALSGEYKIQVRIKDEISGLEATGERIFTVEGRAVAITEKLTVQNLRFLRKDEDGPGLRVAAYQPGETIWIRFEITGFQLGEKNRLGVEYDVLLKDLDDNVLYAQERAASFEDESYYPKRYVPCTFSLTTKPNTTRAEYKLTIAARDLLSGQTVEREATFRLE